MAQIARNEARRALERKVPIPVGDVEDHADEDQQLVDLVESTEVAAALTALSESDRQILKLRYEEDLTQPQISERLGIGESAAKVRLSRARKRLETILLGETPVSSSGGGVDVRHPGSEPGRL